MVETISSHNAKQLWQKWCRTHTVPPFLQPWWWNILAGEDQWNIAYTMTANGKFRAALLYQVRRKFGMRYNTLPPLTPYNGLWLDPLPDAKSHTRDQKYRQFLSALIAQLPQHPITRLTISHPTGDLLPFRWHRYYITPHYTQQIPLTDEPTLWDNLHTDVRRKIQKARANDVHIEECPDDIDSFLDLLTELHRWKKLPLGTSSKVIRSLHRHLIQHKCQTILFAKKGQTVHAAIYLLFSHDTAYYWLGGLHPSFRNSLAMYPLLWEAIRLSAKRAAIFDFNGSNQQSIAQVFTRFGAQTTPRWQVYKTSNFLVGCLLQWWRKMG